MKYLQTRRAAQLKAGLNSHNAGTPGKDRHVWNYTLACTQVLEKPHWGNCSRNMEDASAVSSLCHKSHAWPDAPPEHAPLDDALI